MGREDKTTEPRSFPHEHVHEAVYVWLVHGRHHVVQNDNAAICGETFGHCQKDADPKRVEMRFTVVSLRRKIVTILKAGIQLLELDACRFSAKRTRPNGSSG